jgi:hypothetical protein
MEGRSMSPTNVFMQSLASKWYKVCFFKSVHSPFFTLQTLVKNEWHPSYHCGLNPLAPVCPRIASTALNQVIQSRVVSPMPTLWPVGAGGAGWILSDHPSPKPARSDRPAGTGIDTTLGWTCQVAPTGTALGWTCQVAPTGTALGCLGIHKPLHHVCSLRRGSLWSLNLFKVVHPSFATPLPLPMPPRPWKKHTLKAIFQTFWDQWEKLDIQ